MLTVSDAVALSVADNEKLVDLDPKSIEAAHEVSSEDGTVSLKNVVASFFSWGKKTGKDNNKNTVTVYKPSASFCPYRHRGECPGNSEIVDTTRFATLRISAPPSLVEKVWFHKHELRRDWDTRTALDCRELKGVAKPDPNTKYIWYMSKPKPALMVSARDFVYAFQPTRRTLDPDTGALLHGQYAGCSLDFCASDKDPVVEGWVAQATAEITDPAVLAKAKDVVRGKLQGMANIRGVRSASGKITQSEVTYLLRVRPHGYVPKKAAELAAFELVFPLFELRSRCEEQWRQLVKRARARRNKTKSRL